MQLWQFYLLHWESTKNDRLRLGQRFVNTYIKEQWPELFYCRKEQDAMWMIEKWLEDHHYKGDLPQPLERN